jgi:hypothetical protein
MPLVKKNPEIKNVTQKDRLMWSALSGIGSLAVSSGVAKLLFKNSRFAVPLIAGTTASGIGAGYLAPDAMNTMRREAAGDFSKDESKEILRKFRRIENKAGDKAEEISQMAFEKESSFIGSAFDAARKGLTSSLIAGGSILRKGIFPRTGLAKGQKIPFSRKALSYGVRGGLLGTGTYGGYKVYKKTSGPRSGRNYTTHLRNNVLAGNIKPSEMSQEDLISVRKLGLN